MTKELQPATPKESKIWDETKRDFIDTPDKMSSFFDDIEELCEKYNFSIAHEDYHGSFIIEEYSQYNMNWLRYASKNYKEEK